MTTRRPRLALLALEALPNARAVRRFVADHAGDIALVGLSDPERPSTGGLTGQVRRHLERSGIGILPYLAINFGLPDLMAPLAPLTQRLSASLTQAAAAPMRTLCARLGIPAVTIEDVNGDAFVAAIQTHGIDLIVTFHFDQILTERTLAAVPLGGINVHPSLLPHHRGPVPTIHALAEGTGRFGVTVHRLAATIDAGALLAQRVVPLPRDVTATRAAILLHEEGRGVLDPILRAVAETGAVPEGRTVARLPYCGFPDRAVLAAMRRDGRRLTNRADLVEALTLSSARER